MDTPILRMGRGRWKINIAMFRDERILDGMRHKWALRKHHKRYYPRATLWWVRYVKKQLRSFVRYEEAERRSHLRQMENYFYACICDILRSYTPQEDNWPALKRYKAKMVKLHTDRLNTVLLDNEEGDRIYGEEPTLFHELKMQKRRTARTIQKVQVIG